MLVVGRYLWKLSRLTCLLEDLISTAERILMHHRPVEMVGVEEQWHRNRKPADAPHLYIDLELTMMPWLDAAWEHMICIAAPSGVYQYGQG